jgi:uncharacterized protein (TIGR02246 family)
MTDDERAIRTVIETWMRATKAADTATVLGLMTDDAVFMAPGRTPFGKDAFAAAAQSMRNVVIDGTSEIEEIEVLGAFAYARSFIRVAITPPGGTPVRRSGYTLTIFRRDADGQWRLARDANMLTVDA